jgi:hypothetical protein
VLVWRCSGPRMDLDEALRVVSREVEASWRPGDVIGKRASTDAGFNVLVGRSERWTEVVESLRAFLRDSGEEVLAAAALGGVNEIDIGVLDEPPDRELVLPASLMHDLAELSIDLRISSYL